MELCQPLAAHAYHCTERPKIYLTTSLSLLPPIHLYLLLLYSVYFIVPDILESATFRPRTLLEWQVVWPLLQRYMVPANVAALWPLGFLATRIGMIVLAWRAGSVAKRASRAEGIRGKLEAGQVRQSKGEGRASAPHWTDFILALIAPEAALALHTPSRWASALVSLLSTASWWTFIVLHPWHVLLNAKQDSIERDRYGSVAGMAISAVVYFGLVVVGCVFVGRAYRTQDRKGAKQ